jgi:hypothetical protein
MRDLVVAPEREPPRRANHGQRLEERRRRTVEGERVVGDARRGVAGDRQIERGLIAAARGAAAGVRSGAADGRGARGAARRLQLALASDRRMIRSLGGDRVEAVAVTVALAVNMAVGVAMTVGMAVAMLVAARDPYDRAVRGVGVILVVVAGEVEIRQDLHAEEPEQARGHRYPAAIATWARPPPRHGHRYYDIGPVLDRSNQAAHRVR